MKNAFEITLADPKKSSDIILEKACFGVICLGHFVNTKLLKYIIFSLIPILKSSNTKCVLL